MLFELIKADASIRIIGQKFSNKVFKKDTKEKKKSVIKPWISPHFNYLPGFGNQ